MYCACDRASSPGHTHFLSHVHMIEPKPHPSLQARKQVNMEGRSTPKLVRCGHCEQEVSKRTFYQHKRLYYNSKSKTWNRDARVYHETSSSSSPGDGDFQLQTSDNPSTALQSPGSPTIEGDEDTIHDDTPLDYGKKKL